MFKSMSTKRVTTLDQISRTHSCECANTGLKERECASISILEHGFESWMLQCQDGRTQHHVGRVCDGSMACDSQWVSISTTCHPRPVFEATVLCKFWSGRNGSDVSAHSTFVHRLYYLGHDFVASANCRVGHHLVT